MRLASHPIFDPGTPPTPRYLLEPAIAPGYLTPGQWWFRERAHVRKYGEGDPDVGGFNLCEVVWNKDDGGATVGMCDTGPSAWYGGDIGSPG